MKTPNAWPKAVAHRVGLSGEISFTTTRVGQTLHLPCGGGRGGHIVDFRITGNMPPDFVAKKMLQKGWTIGSKLLCPEHSHGKKKQAPAQAEQQEELIVAEDNAALPQGVELSPPPVSAKLTDTAKAARRAAMQWFEEAFNIEKGQYAEGVSDATIAKETGLAVGAVMALREEFYGPLKEPNDVAEFRQALKECRETIAASAEAARQAVRTLELRLDRICTKNGWGA